MIQITDSQMTSDLTAHCAMPVRENAPHDLWWISWLPDRHVTRNQAITAMVLTEQVANGVTSTRHARWPFVEVWARELDLSAGAAVSRIRGEHP